MPDHKKVTYANPGSTTFSFGGQLTGGLAGLPAGVGIRVALNPAASVIGAMKYVDYAAFERMFGCSIVGLPHNMCAVGWLESERRWYCAPRTFDGIRATHASQLFHLRNNEGLLALVTRSVIEPMGLSRLWFLYCFYDGWRERIEFSPNYRFVETSDLSKEFEWRGAAGEIPILCRDQPWVACFGAHQGDPSAVLLPDLHYLVDRYRALFAEVEAAGTSWEQKLRRAVLAAGDHGEYRNFFVPPSDPTLHPRRLFRQTVEQNALPIDVFLGQPCSRANQMRYRYIADVDGFARTWDAWAWKMMSGSTVLAVDSIWESFFSQQFVAWEHYVPVANDCSDLAVRLKWCMDNDDECAAISKRAKQRALTVYSIEEVARRMRTNFEKQLQSPPTP